MPELTIEEVNQIKNDLRIAKFQLQAINDNLLGGLTSRNIKSFRNTIAFNESDSLDADYPFEMDFEVIPETIKIVSVKVSFKIKKFRAYSKAGASGGGSTPTSSSGGGQTSSSVTTPSGGGATSGGFSGFNSWSWALISSGYFKTATDESKTHGVFDSDTADNIITHTHSTPNHTHPAHSHTVANHTHTVTIGNHTHDAVYGIFEEETSPTIHFWISEDDGGIWKGKHGGYTEDQSNLEITSYLTGNGEKMLKFTSDVRCRISARILLKLDIKAR